MGRAARLIQLLLVTARAGAPVVGCAEAGGSVAVSPQPASQNVPSASAPGEQ